MERITGTVQVQKQVESVVQVQMKQEHKVAVNQHKTDIRDINL